MDATLSLRAHAPGAPAWDPRGPLEKCGAALGIPSAVWLESETLSEISAPPDQQVDVRHVGPAAPALVELVSMFGTSLDARLVWAEHVLPLVPGLDASAVTEFVARLRDAAGVDFEHPRVALVLRVDKDALLRAHVAPRGWPDGLRTGLLLYTETLVKLLHVATTRLEGWWPREGKLVLCAPHWRGSLDGAHLAVLGGDPAVHASVFMGDTQRTRDAARVLYAAAREHLKWERAFTEHLTPLHFDLRGDVDPSDPVRRLLDAHATNLALLFGADYTHNVDGRVVSSYRGSQGKADVEWLEPGAPAARTPGVQGLLPLMRWAYSEGAIPDRLACLQNAVARQLGHVPRAEAAWALVERAAGVQADAEWQLKSVMDKAHEEFGAQIRGVEDYVVDALRAFSERTEQLLRGLSDTMLAAVAVLLGSLAASLFEKSVDLRLVRLGVLLYVVYLLLFPLLYNMTERRASFRVLSEHARERRARFVERLGRAKVDELVRDHVERAEARFRWWYGLAVVTYVAVAGLLFALFVWPDWSRIAVAALGGPPAP